jgi:hypothetical protein
MSSIVIKCDQEDKMQNRLFFLLLAAAAPVTQTQTIGLISNSGSAAAGYTLFAPVESETTYLIDNDGYLIHHWQSTYNPGLSVYLLEDGTLLRTETIPSQKFNGGGSGGRVKMISWEGETTWQFDYSNSDHRQHHDVEPMPNGNILIIAYEVKSRSEAIAAGQMSTLLKQNEVWPDHIVEVKPSGDTGGEIVWEWHAWDHIIQDYDKGKENYRVIAEHPELIDINFVQSGQNSAISDWMHINAVDYNAGLDQIILSVRHFCEVWIIDHSTTTEEAAGHTGGRAGKGGDLTPGSPIEIYAAVDPDDARPTDYTLSNFPNPFNPNTTIRFSIPRNEEVDVKIVNALGQDMETLVHQFLTAGQYEVAWNAGGFASGLYLVCITASHYHLVHKMLLLE